LLKVLAVAIIVLLFSAATAIGHLTTTVDESSTDVEERNDGNESAQSVAMKIEVNEDDVLDLEMARGDVVVDTWDGNDVLVIVERLSTPSHAAKKKPSSLNIEVTRRGRNVHIATLDKLGNPYSDPTVSLRIMVPRRQVGVENVSSIYDLSKLTSVVFKALHREALKWVGR
jgi:hypothetical protein